MLNLGYMYNQYAYDQHVKCLSLVKQVFNLALSFY